MKLEIEETEQEGRDVSEHETHAEIIAEMRIFKCRDLSTGKLEVCNSIANYLADRLEAAHRREASALQRIVRDAIISYSELYDTAPNDDAERELMERVAIANNWLKQNGFEEEPTNWTKEESPCL